MTTQPDKTLAEEVADAVVARLHILPSQLKEPVRPNQTYWMNTDMIGVHPANGLVLVLMTDENGIWFRWQVYGSQVLCEIRMDYAT